MVSYGYLSISVHYQRAAFTIHSARLLAQGHGVCLYVANSIDPEKQGYVCVTGVAYLSLCTLSWQPNFMTVMKYITLKI